MRRIALVSCALLACGLAGGLSAVVLAANGPLRLLQTTTTAPATTGTTTTPTTTTTTTTTPPPPPPPGPVLIPRGVTIAGVPVGDLTPDQAAVVVDGYFRRPLQVRFARRVFALDPRRYADAQVRRAIAYARSARPGARIRLPVKIRRDRVGAFVEALGRRFDREAVESRLSLRHLRPWLTKERPGRVVLRRPARVAILERLAEHSRAPVVVRAERVTPAVTRRTFGPVIVIRRESKLLQLYDGMRHRRTFPIATGQASYPTPVGRFTIVVKARHPWWFPPDSEWARGQSPIPPGPGNPLGTRWMGLSAGGVGIHGTPDAASIGYSASHGCVRMHISHAEWLFNRVSIGTTVFVVAA